MSQLICKLSGVRGREIAVYDNKCVITTNVSVGSLLTNNALDGEKTIFYIDVVGVQFKASGIAVGYLQMETPSMQMNNQSSNMFSENTFTFEDGKNGVTNSLMRILRDYIVSRIEGYKYGTIAELPQEAPKELLSFSNDSVEKIIFFCEKCNDADSGAPGTTESCPGCGRKMKETSITRDEWRALTPEKKEELQKSWNPNPQKRGFF